MASIFETVKAKAGGSDLERRALGGEGTLQQQLDAQLAYKQGAYNSGDRTLETHDVRIARTRQMLAEQKKAEIENVRSVRSAVRQARIARASMVNSAANTGTSGSSGVQGGVSSIGSQLASNLSFFSQMQGLHQESFEAQMQGALATDILNQKAEARARKANSRGQLMGLANLGFSAATFFSDRSIKSNIVRVGTHPLGIGIYEYNIFGKRERGVMADEVERVRPGAVSIGPMGLKMVDYSKLA